MSHSSLIFYELFIIVFLFLFTIIYSSLFNLSSTIFIVATFLVSITITTLRIPGKSNGS